MSLPLAPGKDQPAARRAAGGACGGRWWGASGRRSQARSSVLLAGNRRRTKRGSTRRDTAPAPRRRPRPLRHTGPQRGAPTSRRASAWVASRPHYYCDPVAACRQWFSRPWNACVQVPDLGSPGCETVLINARMHSVSPLRAGHLRCCGKGGCALPVRTTCSCLTALPPPVPSLRAHLPRHPHALSLTAGCCATACPARPHLGLHSAPRPGHTTLGTTDRLCRYHCACTHRMALCWRGGDRRLMGSARGQHRCSGGVTKAAIPPPYHETLVGVTSMHSMHNVRGRQHWVTGTP